MYFNRHKLILLNCNKCFYKSPLLAYGVKPCGPHFGQGCHQQSDNRPLLEDVLCDANCSVPSTIHQCFFDTISLSLHFLIYEMHILTLPLFYLIGLVWHSEDTKWKFESCKKQSTNTFSVENLKADKTSLTKEHLDSTHSGVLEK